MARVPQVANARWTPSDARLRGEKILAARRAEEQRAIVELKQRAEKLVEETRQEQSLDEKVRDLKEQLDQLTRDLPRILPGGGGGRRTIQKILERDYELPPGGSIGDMRGANNLEEIEDAAEARDNLALGTAATTDADAYATAAQGATADSAVQPGDLATVATSGDYGDLANRPQAGVDFATPTEAPAVTANTMLVDNAAGTARVATAFADVRNLLSLPPLVADRTALKALDPTKDTRAGLGEAGRIGIFKAVLTSSLTTDEQAAATADTAEGIYITSGSYTWVREEFTGKNFHVGWFHDWSTTDLATALAGAVAVMEALEMRSVALINSAAARTVFIPSGDWELSAAITIAQGGVRLTADGYANILFTATEAAVIFRHPNYLDGQTLHNIQVDNIRFQRASGQADASDHFLRFFVCRHVRICHNRFTNGTVHIRFDSAQEPVSVHDNTFWHDDPSKTNAYSIRIKNLLANPGATLGVVDPDNGNTYIMASQVFITNNEMRAQNTGVESHIDCEDIDGLQLAGNHIFNGENQVKFSPIVHGFGRIANVKVTDNHFDGSNTGTAHNLLMANLPGTPILVSRLFIESNKFDAATAANIEISYNMHELNISDNEFDICTGPSMIRIEEGGVGMCKLNGNIFRLGAGTSPTTACIDIFMTGKNQFRITTIKDNLFGEDESGAVFPAQAILLTGNPTNACAITIDDNDRDAGFAAFLTDNGGANVTTQATDNLSY